MNISWGARTDIGLVRKGNEDSYLVQEPLFVIADGMGGHVAGDVASSTAVDVITREAGTADPNDPQTLAKMVRDANAAIVGRAQDDTTLQGMGTTCTLLLLDGERAHFAHVGDSRAYLFRNGSLEQVTEDHTLVGRMVREGRLTQDEAQHHPQRNIITRALGNDDQVDVDVFTLNIESGDRILLCSDGLSSMVTNDVIERVLSEEPHAQTAADRLVDLALEAGGEDNVTVVVLDVGGDGQASPGAQTHRAGAADPPPPPPGAPATAQTGAVAPPAPERADEVEDDEVPAAPRSRWIRRTVVSVIVLAVIVGALFGAARYALQNSWYVGVNDDGRVTIYQGRPEDVAGMSLSEVEEVTLIRVDDLPDHVHSDLAEGIKVDSLEEAREAVATLESRARRN